MGRTPPAYGGVDCDTDVDLRGRGGRLVRRRGQRLRGEQRLRRGLRRLRLRELRQGRLRRRRPGPSRAPGKAYDGVINDCDDSDEYDADGDGYDEYGGDGAMIPTQLSPRGGETWYDGVDDDCDDNDDDRDGDGVRWTRTATPTRPSPTTAGTTTRAAGRSTMRPTLTAGRGRRRHGGGVYVGRLRRERRLRRAAPRPPCSCWASRAGAGAGATARVAPAWCHRPACTRAAAPLRRMWAVACWGGDGPNASVEPPCDARQPPAPLAAGPRAGGNAVEFDGAFDYVEIGAMDPGASFTVEAWVGPDAVNSYHTLFGVDISNAQNAFYVALSAVAADRDDNNNYEGDTCASSAVDSLCQAGSSGRRPARRGDPPVNLYIDGVLDATQAVSRRHLRLRHLGAGRRLRPPRSVQLRLLRRHHGRGARLVDGPERQRRGVPAGLRPRGVEPDLYAHFAFDEALGSTTASDSTGNGRAPRQQRRLRLVALRAHRVGRLRHPLPRLRQRLVLSTVKTALRPTGQSTRARARPGTTGSTRGCSGNGDYDQDGDGYDAAAYSGTDCDDTDASVNRAPRRSGTTASTRTARAAATTIGRRRVRRRGLRRDGLRRHGRVGQPRGCGGLVRRGRPGLLGRQRLRPGRGRPGRLGLWRAGL